MESKLTRFSALSQRLTSVLSELESAYNELEDGFPGQDEIGEAISSIADGTSLFKRALAYAEDA